MKRVELLSPAGDFESLKSAIHNGADAVYLSGKNYYAIILSADAKYSEEIPHYSRGIGNARISLCCNQ